MTVKEQETTELNPNAEEVKEEGEEKETLSEQETEAKEGEQEAESKEDEEESETEEEEGEEPSKVKPTDQKASVQKRINQLTGKLKQRDEELEEAREAAKYYRQQLDKKDQSFLEDLPQLNYSGRSIYEMTDAQEDEAVEQLMARTDLDAKTKRENIKLLTTHRAAFKDRLKRGEKLLQSEETKIHNYEWQKVEQALGEDCPELKPFFKEIGDWIGNAKKEKPYLAAKEAEGVLGKYDLVNRAIRALEIDKRLEEGARGKSRPSVDAPVGVSKGSKGVSSGGKTPSFTREQIRKMSLEEYKRHEKDILAAQKAGRIK